MELKFPNLEEITKEQYDLKNEVVENIKDNLKIKALDKV